MGTGRFPGFSGASIETRGFGGLDAREFLLFASRIGACDGVLRGIPDFRVL